MSQRCRQTPPVRAGLIVGISLRRTAFALLLATAAPALVRAQDEARPRPNLLAVTFTAAPTLRFPNPTDSNSPAFWDGRDFYIFNSWGGQPRRAKGTSLDDAADTNPDGASSTYSNEATAGRWLEAVVRDQDTGRLYGWYHQEIETPCPQGRRTWPQIGAAISEDNGETWDVQGVILSPRDGSVTCDTDHPVTNGGIGDFSVILDHNPDPASHYVYFIFSSYGGDLDEQGISFARMLWIDRNQPFDRFSGQSQATKWDGASWNAPGIGGRSVAIFHDSDQVSWTSEQNNGYWGPSVHWNADLQKFIVLMDRSNGGNYETQGVYMTYTTNLDDPGSWAQPKLIIADNQGWYPQVIGAPAVEGTDKNAGTRTTSHTRYFNQAQSDFYIDFNEVPAAAPDPQRRLAQKPRR
jgi:hypothetical protein